LRSRREQAARTHGDVYERSPDDRIVGEPSDLLKTGLALLQDLSNKS
jgi:hypothetical protein